MTLNLTTLEDRMTCLRAQADAEDAARWDDIITGRLDEQRLRRSRSNMQFLRDLPPVVQPDPAEARRRADDAVRGLIGGLL